MVASREVGLGAGDHVVQFYERDSELARSVGDHLAGALRSGGTAIVIATEPHRRAFERRLAAAGVDLGAVDEPAMVWLDAAEVLATFMPAGRVETEAFHDGVGAAVAQAAATGRPVCIYGEMVQLLWDSGMVVAALELESLWNDVVSEHRCSLMCAYRTSSVMGAEHSEALRHVCALHSSVLRPPNGEDVPTAHAESIGAEVAAQFLPELEAPRQARRFVMDALENWHCDAALADDAQLVVSELATNAVVHARSAFSVAVTSSKLGVRVSVRDASPRRPVVQHEPPSAAGGRGMCLVAAVANDWGVEVTTEGKTVWARLRPTVAPGSGL